MDHNHGSDGMAQGTTDHHGAPADGAPAAAGLSRRYVLRGAAAGAAVLAVGGLAACGGSEDSAAAPSGGTTPDGQPASPSADPAQTPEAPASSTPDGGGSSATPIVAASEVAVGGGAIVGQRMVVTQPVAGEFRGFSAICTHQACPVTSVEGGTINCSCHGSRFSIEDGSVQNGPATQPLEQLPVRLEGDQVVQG
jgi:Rieske Fe-S protein